ncbi:hypothetical protein TVAG_228730 [Trichomonas vaginalis G3]|uniref:Uncharacterized protein n=1 Tax=Trichomonas vaginalis (strain ATCC PRA-98 / G3) TaxID=412133 RepID=A2DJ35_TRIV3|nr:hypothetical protein TVAGG3_0470860 [Trichomonas vaginalis G3]EAY19610.1 hypothetical protein TVAG_228730 [Trichomonas vaginalis G3]KAI5515050.1 hypothetical protein TVAGG3_0470860 [Trichomonas vaginalis G3]|eukprot:XP_001580596.1 hypothetical protein [Trichomonas vaginalis G3]
MEEESAAEEVMEPTKLETDPPSDTPGDNIENLVPKVPPNEILKELNLPTIAFLVGIDGIEVKDKGIVPVEQNLEMFTLTQLYSLRSELIQLKAFVDRSSSNIQNTYTTHLHKIRHNLRKPSFQHDQVIIHSKESNISRNLVETEEEEQNENEKEENSEIEQPRAITADTIWETTELFFKPVKDINYFDKYLQKTKPQIDPSKFKEPIGDHYSEVFSSFTGSKSNRLQSQIFIPKPAFVFDEDGTETNYLHSRLFSSFISLYHKHKRIQDNSTSNFSDSEESFETWCNSDHPTSKLRRELSDSIELVRTHVIPSSERIGLTKYGSLDYDTKLKVELLSLGLHPNHRPSEMSNQVSRLLTSEIQSQKKVYSESNRYRKMMEEYVHSGQEIFQIISKRAKNWNSALEIYLKQEEQRKNELKEEDKSEEDENEQTKT